MLLFNRNIDRKSGLTHAKPILDYHRQYCRNGVREILLILTNPNKTVYFLPKFQDFQGAWTFLFISIVDPIARQMPCTF
jgi:hypothetical protein